MNTISIADLRDSQTSSGNSLISVNQQIAIGFGIAFGLIVLKLFEGDTQLIKGNVHNAFRYTFLVLVFLLFYQDLFLEDCISETEKT
jgi:hypothetical protein